MPCVTAMLHKQDWTGGHSWRTPGLNRTGRADTHGGHHGSRSRHTVLHKKCGQLEGDTVDTTPSDGIQEAEEKEDKDKEEEEDLRQP